MILSVYRTAAYILTFIPLSVAVISCGGSSTPKPKGYFRIDLPEKSYREYAPQDCPYSFQYPAYAVIQKDEDKVTEPCWINVDFPRFHAKLHLSYKEVNKNLEVYAEESRTFAYKHTAKANAINEKLINTQNNVHGLLYEIGGNTASSLQFYVTDSSKHFLRGALYFFAQPNTDSVGPVLEFLRKDISEMINSLKWTHASAHVSGDKRK